MIFEELNISGAFLVSPTIHADERGQFYELFHEIDFATHVGRTFELKQSNVSISKKNAFRGIHFAIQDPGQAKYVTCMNGAILDFVVDIRIGSPTFGKWESIELSAQNKSSVFIPEGLGHAFLALEDDTKVSYFVSDVYKPDKEFAINPLDTQLSLHFSNVNDLLLSEKDSKAPSLIEAIELGILPTYRDKAVQNADVSFRGDK